MSRLLAPALLLVPLCLAAGPPSSAPAPGRCGNVYVTVRGDTLYSIARRCRSSVAAIAQASRLADPNRIEVNEPLVIPGPAPAMAEAGKPGPMPASDRAYFFQPTDTLYSLARWARVSVTALLAANPGINPHKIEIGDPIRLPAGAVRPEPARARERGPAPIRAVLPYGRLEAVPMPALDRPPPPLARPEPPRAAPPSPPRPRHKPDDDDEPAPMGM
ncbi:MAG: LysM peptidoglycan-binding domain-containing protein [Sphingomonadaceae bacterium]|nr:LysM peptidoglycan-binding domain-containing protein [Sphingomonadaceae bacterium]